jgi:hypothetical protein
MRVAREAFSFAPRVQAERQQFEANDIWDGPPLANHPGALVKEAGQIPAQTTVAKDQTTRETENSYPNLPWSWATVV